MDGKPPCYDGCRGVIDLAISEVAAKYGVKNHVVNEWRLKNLIRYEAANKKGRYLLPVDFETKVCTACKHYRDVDEFRAARGGDQLTARCKSCREKDAAKCTRNIAKRNEAQRTRAKARREACDKAMAEREEGCVPTEKMCKHCFRTLPMDEFVTNQHLVLRVDERTEVDTCTRCRANYAKHGVKPDVKERKREMYKERRYDRAYVERMMEHDAEAFNEHKAKVQRLWRAANPDRVADLNRHLQLDPVHRISCQFYEGIAKGLFVDPQIGDRVVAIAFEPCVYCGAPAPADNAQSIDRLDSAKGYIPENIVPSCRECNLLKGAMDPITFTTEGPEAVKRFNAQFPLADRIPGVVDIAPCGDPTASLIQPVEPPCATVVRDIFTPAQKEALRQRRPALTPKMSM
jgi:hypothetical protein